MESSRESAKQGVERGGHRFTSENISHSAYQSELIDRVLSKVERRAARGESETRIGVSMYDGENADELDLVNRERSDWIVEGKISEGVHEGKNVLSVSLIPQMKPEELKGWRVHVFVKLPNEEVPLHFEEEVYSDGMIHVRREIEAGNLPEARKIDKIDEHGRTWYESRTRRIHPADISVACFKVQRDMENRTDKAD